MVLAAERDGAVKARVLLQNVPRHGRACCVRQCISARSNAFRAIWREAIAAQRDLLLSTGSSRDEVTIKPFGCGARAVADTKASLTARRHRQSDLFECFPWCFRDCPYRLPVGPVSRASKGHGPHRWAATADKLTATIPTVILMFSRGDDGRGPRFQQITNENRLCSFLNVDPAAFSGGVTCLL